MTKRTHSLTFIITALAMMLTALSSEKPTEEVHNEKDAEADSSIVNGFAASGGASHAVL